MSVDSTIQDKGAGSSKRPNRKRTTGFPVVPLSEAVQVLRKAGKYGFDHTLASFASAMGHTSTNSGAFRQRLAAFRDWGLITGRGDTVTMTEVARVLAVSTDEGEVRQALQEAFHNCQVFNGLYEQMAKGEPIDRDGLGAQAVLKLGVAPGKRQTFVKSFMDSVETAQRAKIDGQGNVILLEFERGDDVDDGYPSDQEPTILEPEESPATPTGRAPHREPSGSLAPTIRQSWPITGGEIIFEVRSEEALPATVFGDLGEVVTKLEALSASLNVPDDSGAIEEGGEE